MSQIVQQELDLSLIEPEFVAPEQDVAPPAAPLAQRIATLIGVMGPFAGLVVAVALTWGWGFTWVEFTLLLTMYLAAGLGVTVGYHRLFTHRAFETFRPVRFIFAVLGSMAVQGPVLRWAAVHRRHHQHSDHEEDPHSPHGHGGGVRGVIRGFWHAHIGWMFDADAPNLHRYVGDLSADRLISFASRFWGLWALLGLIVPAAIGLAITGTWGGALLGFLWGGLARVFFGHHVTWSINSVCHLWGRRAFAGRDHSRNNFIFGWLAFGEGWHNNHHAFPTSARHGLRWWEFDLSWILIRTMALFRLAWDVRLPSSEAMDARRLPAG